MCTYHPYVFMLQKNLILHIQYEYTKQNEQFVSFFKQVLLIIVYICRNHVLSCFFVSALYAIYDQCYYYRMVHVT